MTEQLLDFLANNPHAPLAQEVFSEEQLEEFSARKGKAMRTSGKRVAGIAGGAVAGAGAIAAGTSAVLSRIAPEQQAWYNPARQWGSHVASSARQVGEGIRDTAGQVANWASSGNATIAGMANGAVVGLGTAAAGMVAGGAATARHLYLKKRMKQTGTKSKAAVKEVMGARAAEKKALKKIAGMNKGKLRDRLTKKYGY